MSYKYERDHIFIIGQSSLIWITQNTLVGLSHEYVGKLKVKFQQSVEARKANMEIDMEEETMGELSRILGY